MGKLGRFWEKSNQFEVRKSWQYQLYVALILPGLLFLLAWLLQRQALGVALARLYHTYNLYVASPIPNLAPFNGTGVLGLVILLGLCVWAVRRRDWADLGVTLALGAVNAVYFWLGWNYLLLRFVNITGNVSL